MNILIVLSALALGQVNCRGSSCPVPLAYPAAPTRIVLPSSTPATPAFSPIVAPPPGFPVEGAYFGKDGVNYGIDLDKISGPPSIETITMNGAKLSKSAACEALSDAKLTDDRQFLRLTVTGPKEFQQRVLGDLQRSPLAQYQDRLLVQAYTPDAWQIAEAGFKPGNQVYLQSPNGKVLWRDEGYAAGPESLVGAIRKANPQYRPERDPGPHNSGNHELMLAAAIAVAALLLLNS